MTIADVLSVYAALVASLALGIALLILRVLPDPGEPGEVAQRPAWSPGGPEPGSLVPPIHTGQSPEPAEPGRAQLVAFLSSSCSACRSTLPSLLGYLGTLRLIAVIAGEPRAGADLERLLAPVGTVVFEPYGGPIAAAYRITGYPCYVLLSADSVVLATGSSVLDLPQTQPQ